MKFKYHQHSPTNDIFFLLSFVAFLSCLHFFGAGFWEVISTHVSLPFFVIVIGFLFYLLVFWGVAIPYLLLDHYKIPAALYRHKIQEPASTHRNQIPLQSAVKRVLFNQFFGTLPVLIATFYLMKYFGYGNDLSLPSWGKLMLQFAALVLIEEVLFFTAHYAFHRKFLFRHFHRIHHEYKSSIAIVTHYVHFLEHISANLLPIFAGVVILQPHPFVLFFWLMTAVINALHTHSGYAFPWMNYAVHHDWHHFHVHGSFSALGWMDKVFGTDKDFDALKKRTSQPSQGQSHGRF